MSATVSRQEVTTAIKARRRFRRKPLSIEVQRADAIAQRDLFDLYLWLCGNRGWEWTDTEGTRVAGSSPVAALGGLARDWAGWGFLYRAEYRRVQQLRAYFQRNATPPKPLPPQGDALFLRTDHWFDIKSGGSVGHLRGVIENLRALGHPTHILSSDVLESVPQDAYFHRLTPRYDTGRNLPEIPLIRYTHQVTAEAVAHWSAWNPTFLYQRYSLGNYAAAILKRQFQIPCVCEFNGSIVWIAKNWETRPPKHPHLLDCIERLNLECADLVVVVSQPLKDQLMEWGVPAEKILVNPNGVDAATYAPDVDGSAVRTRYRLEGKTVIGFIGTFGPWHGVEKLTEAYGILLRDHPEYRATTRLLLIGDGGKRGEVERMIETYRLQEVCLLTGLVPQAEGPAHLAACDILASPHVPNPDGTPFFGSPTKLFEYMAMGRCIIASDLDQIGEVLQHDQTAWMVPPGDAPALAQGLQVLIETPERRARLAQASRTEATERYTWKAHTARILAALEARCRP